MQTFSKTASEAAIAYEVAGLAWLGEAMSTGGAHTVRVVASSKFRLETPRIDTVPVTEEAATAFGRALALTHAAGAPHLGAAPAPDLGQGFMGKAPLSFLDAAQATPSWGDFFATWRIMPYLPTACDNGSMSHSEAQAVERLCERLRDGDFDHEQPALIEPGKAARIHGDLWCGNVLWTRAQDCDWAPETAGLGPLDDADAHRCDVAGVLIDPAAQGGHAETDLACLDVFGQRFLDEIYEGYNEVSPLEAHWQERIGLHQLHILIVHAYLFGGGYGYETSCVARRYV